MNRPADTVVIHRWVARQLRPVIAGGVAFVFLAFMALAHFVFHSPEAVKALGMACLGSLGGVFASILVRFEFVMTETGLEKRMQRNTRPSDFKTVFIWEDLDRIVPTRHGFKYYRPISHRSPLDRFWKKWFSDEFSGEVQVEKGDRDKVMEAVRSRGFLPTT